MFRRMADRPVLPRMDLAAQRRRTIPRCQHRMVSRLTSSRCPCLLTPGEPQQPSMHRYWPTGSLPAGSALLTAYASSIHDQNAGQKPNP